MHAKKLRRISVTGHFDTWARHLTLVELLAGIFLVEGVVLDGPNKVVDHQLEDRHDLRLGVIRVVDEVDVLHKYQ